MLQLKNLLKTIRQLGFTQVALFALYKLGLKTGYYKRRPHSQFPILNSQHLFSLPSREELLKILGNEGKKTLLASADEIVAGNFRIFGGNPTEIKLDLGLPRVHWADYETHKAALPISQPPTPNSQLPIRDIKYLWEPARFGWAFTLGRAYRVSENEKYTQAFWRYFEIFDAGNPVNLGVHWMNGQEVAIRLMAFVWAGQIFADSAESTCQRQARLAQSIAEHAERIPTTLLYARSQNNNHLLSEAAGLYTASLALPNHPRAKKWRKLGIKWLNWAFENQIDENGEYIQHSVNYHRLILQLALWVNALTTKDTKKREGKKKKQKKLCEPFCPSCLKKISLATRWLTDLTDPISGNAPNLGANDGAYLFPLTNGDFRDFRPVANAASRAFLNEEPFPIDEMSLWFKVEGATLKEASTPATLNLQPSPLNLQLATLKPATDTWAYLRTGEGNLRLAHADQLHLDLWWRGENITLDPGSYLYNGESPWDNPFPATEFHNTVTVNGLDQMTRASKFMYLDWSRGRVVERSENKIIAEHDGYENLGIIHRREVSFKQNTWRIEDNLQPSTFNFEPSSLNLQPFTYRLHWLLPDGKWNIESREKSAELTLKISKEIAFRISILTHCASHISLARAGKIVYGNASPHPARGWSSPTYGVKIPALSLALETTASNQVTFITDIQLRV